MTLLNVILIAEFSVVLLAIGIWVYHRSRELERWVNDTHIDYHFSQDFDNDWAALTISKFIASMLIAGGLLGMFVALLPLIIWVIV